MCVFSGESRKGGCGDHVKNKKKVVVHDRQKTFLHEEKQGIIITDSRDQGDHGGERQGKMFQKKWGGDMPQGVSFLVEGCASVFPLKPLCSLWGWFACFFFQGKLAVREATSQDKEKKIL